MEEQHVAVSKEYARYYGKWYYWERCPLFPILRIRQPDRYNEWSFSWHWLVFRVWSMVNPDLGFGVNLDDQCLEIRLRIPYLIIGAWIPLFPLSWHQKIWRCKKW